MTEPKQRATTQTFGEARPPETNWMQKGRPGLKRRAIPPDTQAAENHPGGSDRDEAGGAFRANQNASAEPIRCRS